MANICREKRVLAAACTHYVQWPYHKLPGVRRCLHVLSRLGALQVNDWYKLVCANNVEIGRKIRDCGRDGKNIVCPKPFSTGKGTDGIIHFNAMPAEPWFSTPWNFAPLPPPSRISRMMFYPQKVIKTGKISPAIHFYPTKTITSQ